MKTTRKNTRVEFGRPCPRCGATATRQSSNFGRPIPGRYRCAGCGQPWSEGPENAGYPDYVPAAKKERLSPAEFGAFLRELAASGLVRVVGSYAAGTENTRGHVSDLDLYVLRGPEGLRRVIQVFEKHGVRWDSVVVGAIHSPRDLEHLPLPVECSYLFDCRRGEVFDLDVRGVRFPAYRP